jgi:plastocyanin
MGTVRYLSGVIAALTILLSVSCGTGAGPTSPAPPGEVATANAYILPGAVNLGPGAFGDHPLVIYKGERLRWRNVDGVAHNLEPDTASLPEFVTTGLLPGGEQSFIMNTLGRTTFHCTIHPQMVGTLVVQER